MTAPVDDEAVRPPRRKLRWGAIAGTVVLAYVLVYAVALTRLHDRLGFDDWAEVMHGLGGRLVLSGVVLASLFHTFDGLRRMAIEVRPALASRDEPLRTAVLFATWALAVPAAAVLVWPWISDAMR